jgi:hypothetical protein
MEVAQQSAAPSLWRPRAQAPKERNQGWELNMTIQVCEGAMRCMRGRRCESSPGASTSGKWIYGRLPGDFLSLATHTYLQTTAIGSEAKATSNARCDGFHPRTLPEH